MRFLTCLSLSALLISPTACQSTGGLPAQQARDILVVAHRGCIAKAPENSLAAIRDCAGLGVDIVETDVRLLSDGTPGIIHDETLDRTTNSVGPVALISPDAFVSLRLKEGNGGPDTALTTDSPPLLSDVLASRPDGLMLNLDVKDEAAYRAVGSMLAGRSADDDIILKSSMSPDNPRFAAFSKIGESHFMPVVRQCGEGQRPTPETYCAVTVADVLEDFEGINVYGYELIFHEESFLSGFAAAVEGKSVEIWVNALAPGHAAGHTDALALENPDAHWGRLVDLGATILQTDYPAELRAWLDNRRAAQP